MWRTVLGAELFDSLRQNIEHRSVGSAAALFTSRQQDRKFIRKLVSVSSERRLSTEDGLSQEQDHFLY